ncbi:MAG: GNAT family N-acetyltransferase [Renibacterium salmoninarum]|nr:GNAT family N-acetyltransferase [Renibacterium salmoninarum]
MSNDLVITALRLPATLDAPDAADFHSLSAAVDQIKRDIWHNDDRLATPLARLVSSRSDEYRERLIFLGQVAGETVGYCWAMRYLKDNPNSAYLFAAVLPQFRRRGYGRTMLEHVERLALHNGRTVFQSGTEHPADFDLQGTGALVPKSGSGAVPLDSAAVQFARQAGYELELVERFSELPLPLPPEKLQAFVTAARAKSGDGYRLVFWKDRVPEEIVESFTTALTQMSIDIPTAGLDYEAEYWDVARLRKDEADRVAAGQGNYGCAAVDRASGEVAAYSYFGYHPEKPGVLSQEDTFVSGAHRGKRLGMLIKAANLQRMAELVPQAEKVITWNAAENGHMLAINVDLGFTPAGYDGEWQKISNETQNGSAQ